MADNTVLPAGGAGDTIAADDIAGVKYQRVKLIYGADGVNSGDVSTSNMLPVQILAQATSIAKAEDAAHASGDVGVPALAVQKLTPANLAGTDADYEPMQISNGRLYVSSKVHTRVQVTPTISLSAYTSGDQLGGLMDVASAARKTGGSGIVKSIIVLDKTQAQRANIDLVFFDRSVTVAADNAVFTISDADMAFCLGVVALTTYNTAWAGTPANSILTNLAVNLPFVLSGTSLYVAAVVRATPTYVGTSDLVFTYIIEQD